MKLWLTCVFVLLVALPAVAAPQAKSRTTPVAVGETAPDFTLESHLGGTVTLSKVLERGPAVVVFYRGHWCPFCARQLAELRSLLPAGGNASLVAISVDGVATNRDFAKKIAKDGRGELGYPILSDPGHKTIDAFGLHDSAYDGQDVDGIPHAAVYVIGAGRKVTWAHVSDDYKVRPSNDEIRAALGV